MPEFIDLGDVRTAFEVAGEGPPLLMLHGAEGSRRQFARILPALSDRYTVISYDQRDCGDTVGPERAPTLIDLADDAMQLLEALGHASAFVFGTSFGGRVAQAFAVRHAKAVRRLVLASTWPLPVSLAQANAEVARETAVLQLAALFFPAPFLAEHPAFKAHFAAAPARSARSDRRAAVVGDLPELALSDIDRPTLLVAGELDRVVPAALTLSLAQHIRDTRSVLLPGVGHLGTAQAPEALALHLREFLA
jgi:pimeloyl-ACP methyl ester carboxylesterase